eukprot:1705541-Prymnesium_polylepis.1
MMLPIPEQRLLEVLSTIESYYANGAGAIHVLEARRLLWSGDGIARLVRDSGPKMVVRRTPQVREGPGRRSPPHPPTPATRERSVGGCGDARGARCGDAAREGGRCASQTGG